MNRWIWSFCALLSCRLEPAPLNPPAVNADGGAVDCTSACANLQRLGCPEGSPEDDSCIAQCEAIEASGIASVNPACQSVITSCDQIDSCAP
jgi:hypothetical protein